MMTKKWNSRWKINESDGSRARQISLWDVTMIKQVL